MSFFNQLFASKATMAGLAVGGGIVAHNMHFNRSTGFGKSEELSSPLTSATNSLVTDVLGQGHMGLIAGIGLEFAAGRLGKSAIKEYGKAGRTARAQLRGWAPGTQSWTPRNRIAQPKKTGFFSKTRTNKTLKNISKMSGEFSGAASKAKLALKLGKWGRTLNFASMALTGFQMMTENFSLPNPVRGYKPTRQASLGGTFNDSEEAYTQRQRALQMIQSSQYGGRSALGHESEFFHQ